jgi:hypothetical protein
MTGMWMSEKKKFQEIGKDKLSDIESYSSENVERLCGLQRLLMSREEVKRTRTFWRNTHMEKKVARDNYCTIKIKTLLWRSFNDSILMWGKFE